MEKKTECEVVQDLLLGYVDNVLNAESKKLVEKHLLQCSSCQKRLEEIRKDMKVNEEVQKKEIDYLKKIRIKARVKSIFFAILIILTILVGYYLYKFSILNGISEKVSKKFKSENFYIETISNAGYEEDGLFITKVWYKDGKCKRVSYIETEENGITQTFNTRYSKIGEKEEYEIVENEKKAVKTMYLFENKKENVVSFPNPIFLSNMKNYMIFRLGTPFFTKISTDNKEIGREYYVLNLGDSKLWVDIETGLPIMSFGYTTQTQYYKDTKIPKKSAEGICQYKYEFDVVKDDDVQMPDLSTYTIENVDLFNK